ncbi:MAG: 30S ribosomal protein S12 methylthiotransferase RimO [Candidatus Omnitrophota bacterium]
MKVKIGIISLGCARNLVDSEVMLGFLKQQGMLITDKLSQADVALINTCAFIKDAKQESIDIILQLINLKKEGKVKKIIVAGCLPQRYFKELNSELPEIDGFIGPGGVNRIIEVVHDVFKGKRPAYLDNLKFLYTHQTPREFITKRHSVYVKIAEGCRNFCSYCVISKIRGKYRSRRMTSIVTEIKDLTQNGTKEINIISQDTTLYGIDLYGRPKISELVKKISHETKVTWLRLLYNHPAHFSDELIEQFKYNSKLCRYVDLPLQHINDKILSRMNRQTTKAGILQLIEKLRKIEDLVIRTTFIVGFHGETNRQFCELLDFIRDVKFERLGIFIYSPEEDTPAYRFDQQVAERVKTERFNILMQEQQKIAAEQNQKMIGKTIKVIVDEIDETDKNGKTNYITRSAFDAPDVDGVVFVKSRNKHKIGDFLSVKIIDALEYDLVARALNTDDH